MASGESNAFLRERARSKQDRKFSLMVPSASELATRESCFDCACMMAACGECLEVYAPPSDAKKPPVVLGSVLRSGASICDLGPLRLGPHNSA